MKPHASRPRSFVLVLIVTLWTAIVGAPHSGAAEEAPGTCEPGVRLASRAVQVPQSDRCPPITNGRFVVSGVLELGADAAAPTMFRGHVTPPNGTRTIMCSCPVSGCRAEWFACDGYGGPNGCAACCAEGCGIGPLSTDYDYCIGG